MELKTFIIIGRSGSGKGTQASLLIDEIKRRDLAVGEARSIMYMEAGARFRELLAQDNYTSNIAKSIGAQGKLQPAFLAIHVWSHILINSLTGGEHLVIDGSPRKLSEARILADALRFYSRPTPTILHINVSRDWAKERLLARHRSDDEVKNVEGRLNWFDSDVAPAIEFFRDEPDFRVIDINGEQSIEDVNKNIFAKVFDEN